MATPSADHLQHLCTLFSQTLDPVHRKSAEQHLLQAQSQPGFLQLLIHIVQSSSLIQTSNPIRLSAAIKLKNICKTAWDIDSAEQSASIPLEPQDKIALKQAIIPLLVSISTTADGRPPAPANVRSQLEEAIALVAEKDFPQEWPSLMDDLVPKLAEGDDRLVLAVLRTSHTIFYRWRSAFRSDALYSEINYVLSKFALAHLQLLTKTDQRLLHPKTPPESIPVLGNILNVALQVFYDLSSQDLPPQIEDNMAPITEILARWISQSRPELDADPDEPCTLQEIRSSICEIAELYAKRYLDAFPQLPTFVQGIWEMLKTSTLSHKYDTLVSKAVGFLSTVVRMGSSREMFQSAESLEQLCSAIILPNIAIREADEELFEDNPIEYIRRDLETSMEADTRRKAASEFCRSLMQLFSSEVTRIVSGYIMQYLEQYRADPQAGWKQKDTAIYLLTSIASKSCTAQGGVTSTNELVDVVKFFSDNVFADLQQSSEHSPSPILQVDAIKYLHTFRNQLTKEQLLSVLPLLVQHLESSQYVTCSYASITIESILALKREGKMLFTSTDITPFSEPILMALLTNIERGNTPEKIAENDYLVKCIFRILATVREAIAPAHTTLLSHLAGILGEISKNPSNPRFSQYLFESIAALIRYTVAVDAESLQGFEGQLFPRFTAILTQDVAEFQPYVFQILSQMLELHPPTAGLPETYSSLLPPILTPACWENRGNVPALVRLVRAFLAKDAQRIVAQGQLAAMLGIYQKLISTRINEAFALELLETLFEAVPSSALDPYKRAILTMLLTRLQQSKTGKLVKCTIHLISSISLTPKGADYAIGLFEAVQPGLFLQIAQSLIIPELPSVAERQKKVVSVGFGMLLTNSTLLRTQQALGILADLLNAHIKLLLTPSAASVAHEEQHFLLADQDAATAGFQNAFSKLAASETTKSDPTDTLLQTIPARDTRVWFSTELDRFRSHVGEHVWESIWRGVGDDTKFAWQTALGETQTEGAR